MGTFNNLKDAYLNKKDLSISKVYSEEYITEKIFNRSNEKKT
jgi:hypothetical protein